MLSWMAIQRRLFGIRTERDDAHANIEWPRVRIVNTRPDAPDTFVTPAEGTSGSAPWHRRCCPTRRRSSDAHAANSATTPLDTNTTTNMPLLYSLARTWAWEAVIFRSQTHAHEASEQYRDYLGDTCLHWTVFGRPPVRAVHAILTACPATAHTPNDAGDCALHVACAYRASSDVIAAVLEAYPQAAVTPSKQGVYPIHLLCDYGNGPESMQALLSCTEGMESVHLVDPRFQRRPLYLLNERKNLHEQQEHTELVRSRRLRQRAIRAQESGSGSDWEERGWLHHELMARLEDDIRPLHADVFWETVALVIVAEYQRILASIDNSDHAAVVQMPACMLNTEHSDDSQSQKHATILHACVGNPDCPPSLQEYALLLYEPYLLTPDARGRCPLHLAASMYACHHSDSTVDLMRRILEACPKAASIRDGNGHLPFSVAVRRTNRVRRRRVGTGGLDTLMDANPLALLERNIRLLSDDTCRPIDYVTTKSIYPVVLARLSSNALFTLFKANPSMMLTSAQE